jgi:hypothetical protein
MSHPPFVAHGPKHIDPQKEHPRRAALTTVPDLRFEYGFLKSVRPYFRLRTNDSKGKEKETNADAGNVVAGPVDTLDIQWLDVAWITTRDQVLSPLLQGALWYVSKLFRLNLPANNVQGNCGSFLDALLRAGPLVYSFAARGRHSEVASELGAIFRNAAD